jgi:hypothetical protein
LDGNFENLATKRNLLTNGLNDERRETLSPRMMMAPRMISPSKGDLDKDIRFSEDIQ